MSETPKHHDPDPPPASSVTEENKPSPTVTHQLRIDGDRLVKEAIPPALTTHHSPAPWSLHPQVNSEIGACFEIRDAEGGIVAYTVYSEDRGIGAIEWADAHLILAAPRLLSALSELFQDFMFLLGHVAFEPDSSAAAHAFALQKNTSELLIDMHNAGVL